MLLEGFSLAPDFSLDRRRETLPDHQLIYGSSFSDCPFVCTVNIEQYPNL